MSRDGYVTRAEESCLASGCMLHTAAGVLGQAREVIRQNGRDGMSQALWCDQSGHAFSERDPGRQRVKVNQIDEDGNEVEIAKDLCGECAVRIGITAPRKTRSALPTITATVQDAAAAAEREDDHLMLRQLQQRLADLEAERTARVDSTGPAGTGG